MMRNKNAPPSIKHYQSILRGAWLIKFSIADDQNILLTFVNVFTGQVIMRYHTNEDDAVNTINYITQSEFDLEQ